MDGLRWPTPSSVESLRSNVPPNITIIRGNATRRCTIYLLYNGLYLFISMNVLSYVCIIQAGFYTSQLSIWYKYKDLALSSYLISRGDHHSQ